jgi:hypothetical protein
VLLLTKRLPRLPKAQRRPPKARALAFSGDAGRKTRRDVMSGGFFYGGAQADTARAKIVIPK